MNRSDLDRLRDARDFAKYARDNAGGPAAKILADALQPQHAAFFALVVVGEALGHVSSEVKSAASHLPWRPVKNLRNILIHSYRQIDLEIIADIIEHRIDPLVEQLNQLIALVERSES